MAKVSACRGGREERQAPVPPGPQASAPCSGLLPAADARPPAEGGVPLSLAQERLWFLERLGEGGAPRIVPGIVRFPLGADPVVLERALGEIVRRHDVLRTRFRETEGLPRQEPAPFAEFVLPVEDLSAAMDPDHEVRRHAAREAAAAFDLTTGPLFRARFLRLGRGGDVLLLAAHPIVCDGRSRTVLLRELSTLCAALRVGADSPLPPLPLQYADYVVWQRDPARGEVYERQLAYWRARLSGAPALLTLPADQPRPPVQSFRHGTVPVSIPPRVLERLRQLARSGGTTLYVVVLTAFQALLSRYAGTDDVVVGTRVAGRTYAEVRDLIGVFTNTLVLRTDLAGDPTFRDAVCRVREVVLGARRNQEIPFELVVQQLRPERTLSHSALFQVVFQLRAAAGPSPREPHGGSGHGAAAGADLALDLRAHRDALEGVLEYSVELFERGTARRMAERLLRILEQASSEPDTRLSRLQLMGRSERARVLEWNRTTARYPADRCIHHLFEEQAARTPEAVAVVSDGASLTYRELDAEANRLAWFLQRAGVGPEVRVGLCLERGLLVMPAILGVMKAGGAYVPVDPAHPPERIRYVLEDAGATVLLTTNGLRDRLPSGPPPRVVSLDGDWSRIAAESPLPPPCGATSENLAYVIYTSGSTGQPKGVAMHHRGVANYIHWGVRAYGADRGNGAPIFSSLAVDLTLTNLLPLFAGRPVHFLSEASPLEALADALREKPRYGLLKITPTHLALLNDLLGPEEMRGAAETLVVGADFLNAEPTVPWQQEAPGVRLMNEYGPTETVVGCSAYVLPPGTHRAGPVPVGRPIHNLAFSVLDDRMEPVPVGFPGELYVGGAGVARGYLGRPALTAERFLPDAVGGNGARMYRTGDRARWLANGNLLILGRTDRQVKIRGYRVELGEVEAAVRSHDGVTACVVAMRPARSGPPRLVAYVVGEVGADSLRAHLRASVPEHMIPDAFVGLDALPQTPTGKVDPSTLPEPEAAGAEDDEPGGELEAELAAMWGELLGLPAVGATRSFFELGGNSFLAVRLVARVNRRFDSAVPVSAVFAGATVRQLAAAILRRREEAAAAAAVRRKGTREISFERAIQFASELIRIPSLPGDEGAVARRIVEELRSLGFDEARTDRAGNVIGRIAGRGEAPAVMLSSHMDIVDVGEPAGWEHDPYGGIVADGYLHGRGAMDLKGPLALQLYAAARFVEARPAGDILAVCSVFEEKGGWGMMHLMRSPALRPGAVILAEATDGDLCTGHRGHAELAVEIHGLAAHASDPARGRNPNQVLPAVLAVLNEISKAQPEDAVLGRATFTPTVIESWPKSGNVIPDRVRVTLDLRVLPGWREDEALAEIRRRLADRVLDADGLRVEVLPGRATFRAWTGWSREDGNFTPGFLMPDHHPVVRAAVEALGRATGTPPVVRQWKFGTDGGHTCGTHGIPTIGFAPGKEELAHTTRERLSLEAARQAFDAYPELILAVQEALAASRGLPLHGIRIGAPAPQ